MSYPPTRPSPNGAHACKLQHEKNIVRTGYRAVEGRRVTGFPRLRFMAPESNGPTAGVIFRSILKTRTCIMHGYACNAIWVIAARRNTHTCAIIQLSGRNENNNNNNHNNIRRVNTLSSFRLSNSTCFEDVTYISER